MKEPQVLAIGFVKKMKAPKPCEESTPRTGEVTANFNPYTLDACIMSRSDRKLTKNSHYY